MNCVNFAMSFAMSSYDIVQIIVILYKLTKNSHDFIIMFSFCVYFVFTSRFITLILYFYVQSNLFFSIFQQPETLFLAVHSWQTIVYMLHATHMLLYLIVVFKSGSWIL